MRESCEGIALVEVRWIRMVVRSDWEVSVVKGVWQGARGGGRGGCKA